MPEMLNLFCLPFAGGNRYSYREFDKIAHPLFKIVTLEYPGRGARIKESLVTDIHNLVDDLYAQITPLIGQKEYAIYGHSMGGLATYLLTLKLLENGYKPPVQLFITGTTGPAATSRLEKKRHLLGTQDFINEIRELDGMPEEILQNTELLDYLVPILRADFTASETYQYKSSTSLDLPITVITGSEEDMEESDIRLWDDITAQSVDFIQMPGKHFFIFKHTNSILEIIQNKLRYSLTPN